MHVSALCCMRFIRNGNGFMCVVNMQIICGYSITFCPLSPFISLFQLSWNSTNKLKRAAQSDTKNKANVSYGTSVKIKANNWRILCDYVQYPLKSWQEKRFPCVTFFSPSVSFMRIIFIYPKSIQNYIKHRKMMISCDLTKCLTQLFAVLRMRISFFGKNWVLVCRLF